MDGFSCITRQCAARLGRCGLKPTIQCYEKCSAEHRQQKMQVMVFVYATAVLNIRLAHERVMHIPMVGREL